jgi:hypothetical protein
MTVYGVTRLAFVVMCASFWYFVLRLVTAGLNK